MTSFRENGEVNHEKLEEIIEEQIVDGTDTIIACNTTGEASTVTHEEHLEAIEYICRVTRKRIPVTAGTSSNCTETAVYLSTEVEKRGVGGLLLVLLYYNKATRKRLVAHSTAIADATKIPATFYNIPDGISVAIKPETIMALCEDVGNTVGVKEVSDNLSVIAILIGLSDGKVDLYSGNNDQIIPLLSLGGKGVISVLSNVASCQTHDICAPYFMGDVKTSASPRLKTIPLITELFSEVSPIPVKVTINMMGRGVGPLRTPLTEMEPQNQKKFKKVIMDYDILQGRFRERAIYQW